MNTQQRKEYTAGKKACKKGYKHDKCKSEAWTRGYAEQYQEEAVKGAECLYVIEYCKKKGW